MFAKLWEEFLFGLRNLARYKLRSFLTTLGIIFGISSVIAMMAVGAGARAEILERIQQLGMNNIIINSVKPPEKPQSSEQRTWTARYGLTFRDFQQIEETCPQVADALPVHFVKQPVWYKSKRLNVKVLGVPPDYLDTFHLEPKLGRRFTDVDSAEYKRVCLARENVLRDLAILEDPLTLDLKIGEEYFRIVGVLPSAQYDSPTSKALALEGRSSEIYIPYKTVLNVYGTMNSVRSSGNIQRTQIELDQIVVSASTADSVFAVAQGIDRILEKFHKEPDYEMIVPLELLQQSQETQRVFSIVMILIASISLLVGGIGIVNIMLATITERTREIGIRRAVGARQNAIVLQFLMETLAIAVIGGIFGCLLGFFAVKMMAGFTGWRTIISPESVIISMGISCAVGILFGLYPAYRASRMDPIQALRWE